MSTQNSHSGVAAAGSRGQWRLIVRVTGSARRCNALLATALATKVSWQVPFDHAPAASLGASSPWADTLDRVLRTPKARSGRHAAFITTAAEAGEVIAHIADAAGGLDVVSVAAMPDVPPGRVLAAAYDIAGRHATAAPIESRELADLTPGEHAADRARGQGGRRAAVLPAWSAASRLDLSAPGLGFDAAGHALVRNDDPWQALQEAMARYTTTGFEAAAANALIARSATYHSAAHREVTLRFGHPYAAVAVITDSGGPWRWSPGVLGLGQRTGERDRGLRARRAAMSTANPPVAVAPDRDRVPAGPIPCLSVVGVESIDDRETAAESDHFQLL